MAENTAAGISGGDTSGGDISSNNDDLQNSHLPRVAIVGRPNVGKSTLLNRIAGRRAAIVEARPGVTRDRKEVEVDWQGWEFLLIDTGGWLTAGSDIDHKVSAQSEHAIDTADLLLFVVDATLGATQEDADMAAFLHRRDVPTLLVANKADSPRQEALAWEFVNMGFGDPWPLSALHGRGTADVLDEVVKRVCLGAASGSVAGTDYASAPAETTQDSLGSTRNESPRSESPSSDSTSQDSPATPSEPVVSVAIVGMPNVGKSTLFNKLVGEARSVVHDEPGTTRDSVDSIAQTELGPIRFVDTAGLRRKARIDQETERYAALRALRSIDQADIVLLVIDATAGVTHQDLRLAERVDNAGCPVLLLLNKWELLNAEQRAEVREEVQRRLSFVGDGSVFPITALTGRGTHKILPALSGVVDDYRKRVPTRLVNKTIREAQAAHSAPGGARVLYATQGATDPPTFLLFVNRKLPPTYVRYLERKLREELSFGAAPLRMRVRLRS